MKFLGDRVSMVLYLYLLALFMPYFLRGMEAVSSEAVSALVKQAEDLNFNALYKETNREQLLKLKEVLKREQLNTQMQHIQTLAGSAKEHELNKFKSPLARPFSTKDSSTEDLLTYLLYPELKIKRVLSLFDFALKTLVKQLCLTKTDSLNIPSELKERLYELQIALRIQNINNQYLEKMGQKIEYALDAGSDSLLQAAIKEVQAKEQRRRLAVLADKKIMRLNKCICFHVPFIELVPH